MCKLSKIAEAYCQSYGLTLAEISTEKEYRGKYLPRKIKVFNGVHIDYMRMCLAYYFRHELNQPVGITAKLAGYQGHSNVSKYVPRTKYLIEVADPYITPYYQALMDIVNVNKKTSLMPEN